MSYHISHRFPRSFVLFYMIFTLHFQLCNTQEKNQHILMWNYILLRFFKQLCVWFFLTILSKYVLWKNNILNSRPHHGWLKAVYCGMSLEKVDAFGCAGARRMDVSQQKHHVSLLNKFISWIFPNSLSWGITVPGWGSFSVTLISLIPVCKQVIITSTILQKCYNFFLSIFLICQIVL